MNKEKMNKDKFLIIINEIGTTIFNEQYDSINCDILEMDKDEIDSYYLGVPNDKDIIICNTVELVSEKDINEFMINFYPNKEYKIINDDGYSLERVSVVFHNTSYGVVDNEVFKITII